MLKPVDRDAYTRAMAKVPEHAKKVRQVRAEGSPYHRKEYVYDPEGNLVGLHDDDGQYYASTVEGLVKACQAAIARIEHLNAGAEELGEDPVLTQLRAALPRAK